MSSIFGTNAAGEIVHVSDVARGLACGCRCVVCEEPLVARQGAKREHHFAHASNTQACESSHESLLHRYAKQLIAQHGGLWVPQSAAIEHLLQLPCGEKKFFLGAQNVQLEATLASIRPDILLTDADGVQFAIEIAYSSFCDLEKQLQFSSIGLAAVEIDLSEFSPEAFEVDAVRDAVLHGLQKKQWLWPQAADGAQDAADDAPAPAPDAPVVSAAAAPRFLPEEILDFSGRWVSLKVFPSGGLAVKVIKFDPQVVSVVSSICRRHAGQYNAAYRSWNVPPWRASHARAMLRECAARMRIGVSWQG